MAEFILDDVLKATGAYLLSGEGCRFSCISTDSRQIKPGALFIALKGENFDGHDFVIDAMARGALGALVSRKEASARGNYFAQQAGANARPIILSEDPLKALGDLANFHRRRCPIKLVAVSGSNGKTTVKEMTAHILSRRYRTLKSPGNLNNLIGVPLTLLGLSPHDEMAVVEMGISARGELKRLCQIAEPDVGVLTNIGPAHIELIGSIENIKLAKKELLDSLGPSCAAVINADDPNLLEMAAGAKAKIIRYGFGPLAEIKAEQVNRYEAGLAGFILNYGREPLQVRLKAIGSHNIYNALAAATVASHFGLTASEVRAGLEEFKGVPMHMELKRLRGGAALIDDSYNANPVSMAAAAAALASIKASGRAFFVAGDMLELGSYAQGYHSELGRQVAQLGIDYFFAMGNLSKLAVESARASGMPAECARWCSDHLELASMAASLLRSGDVALVKGSRRMRMEKVGQYLARIKGVC